MTKALGILLLAALAVPAQTVNYDRIKGALKDQNNWLTYWGDYTGIRHRELNQINASNVKDLRLEWMFQQSRGVGQTMPLVVDGVMFLTTGYNGIYAIDAKTGRELWSFQYPLPAELKLINGYINRGVAMLDGTLFLATLDAHVIAVDSKSGKLLWDTPMAENAKGYAATLAPLVVKDKVIAGVSGGEYGIRGFLDAFDVKTGKRAWRFYTIPAKQDPGGDTWLADSWKRGGGPTWMTGTFDPELNLVYWTVGNPGPDLYGKDRLGDNLYTCSVIALDADTGKLKWHFQFTPHDVHDWDANETPVLVDLPWKGQTRKLLMQANRNGFFYLLDRATGEFLSGKPFARQTWANGLDDKGRPMVKPGTEPTPEGNAVCPGLAGATNWMAPAFNPKSNTFYVQVREQCDTFYSTPPIYIEGKQFWGSVFRGVTEDKEWGALLAMDPLTGQKKWEFRYHKAPWAGILSTDGGLVFSGDEDGYFMAFDAESGKNLWKVNLGTAIKSSAITYMVEGRQYITIPSGSALVTFALPGKQ
jgi:alcohol dehydrogenase (cytochrome c)